MRPFILKASYYRGRKGSSFRGALAHFKYMGNPKKEELLTAADGDRDRGEDEAAIHARYMSERAGSLGYISQDPLRDVDPAALGEELRNHTGTVWRVIVSVTEADAKAMGGDLMGRAAWEAAAREVVPKMAAAMNIPADHLRWTAAVHRKEGHPHMHLLLWSADPVRGYLGPRALTASKREWVSALYRPERERLGKEKSELRQAVTAGARDRLSNRDEQQLAARLHQVAGALRGHGRLAWAYMPQETKALLTETADWLLRSDPALWAAASRYRDLAVELATHYSDNAEQHTAAGDRALADLRERLAGGILREAIRLERTAAWGEVTRTVWDAIAGEQPGTGGATDSDSSVGPRTAIQAAVQTLGRPPTRETAMAAAAQLLREQPDLAAAAAKLRDLAGRSAREDKGATGEPTGEDKAADAARTLEERVAAMLFRQAIREERTAVWKEVTGSVWEAVRPEKTGGDEPEAPQASGMDEGIQTAIRNTVEHLGRQPTRETAMAAAEQLLREQPTLAAAAAKVRELAALDARGIREELPTETVPGQEAHGAEASATPTATRPGSRPRRTPEQAAETAAQSLQERVADTLYRAAVQEEKRAAWKEATGTVWGAVRNERKGSDQPAAPEVTVATREAIRNAVRELAGQPDKDAALAAAVRLLRDQPELIAAAARVREIVAKAGERRATLPRDTEASIRRDGQIWLETQIPDPPAIPAWAKAALPRASRGSTIWRRHPVSAWRPEPDKTAADRAEDALKSRVADMLLRNAQYIHDQRRYSAGRLAGALLDGLARDAERYAREAEAYAAEQGARRKRLLVDQEEEFRHGR